MATVTFVPFSEVKPLSDCQPGDVVYSLRSKAEGPSLVVETNMPNMGQLILLMPNGPVARELPHDTLVMPYSTQEYCIEVLGSVSPFVGVPEQNGALLHRDGNWQLLLQTSGTWECYDFRSGKFNARSGHQEYICQNWRLIVPRLPVGATSDPKVIFERPARA
ncbi:MAG: hypothetical protein AB7E81_17695 [Hyphomicrobiaceae bacterium]